MHHRQMSQDFRVSRPLAAVALVGVFLASTTGGAVGAALITGADIQDGSVAGIDLRDGSVAGTDLRDGTVTGTDLRDGTVAPADLNDNAMWAIVTREGTLLQGNGVAEVTGGSSGTRHIKFVRSVNNRAIVATLLDDRRDPESGDVFVTPCVIGQAAPCGALNEPSKWVRIYTTDGVFLSAEAVPRAFLVVVLPSAPGTVNAAP